MRRGRFNICSIQHGLITVCCEILYAVVVMHWQYICYQHLSHNLWYKLHLVFVAITCNLSCAQFNASACVLCYLRYTLIVTLSMPPLQPTYHTVRSVRHVKERICFLPVNLFATINKKPSNYLSTIYIHKNVVHNRITAINISYRGSISSSHVSGCKLRPCSSEVTMHFLRKTRFSFGCAGD